MRVKRKRNIIIIFSIFICLTACTNKNELREYEGLWTLDGRTWDDIVDYGGAALHISFDLQNQMILSYSCIQETTGYVAELDAVACEAAEEVNYHFSDDGRGNSGILHLTFLDNKIKAEIKNLIFSEEGSSLFSLIGGELYRESSEVRETAFQKKNQAEANQIDTNIMEISKEVLRHNIIEAGKDEKTEFSPQGINPKQSFYVDLNDWNEVRFVTWEPDLQSEQNETEAMNSDVRFYLLDDKGEVSYEFPGEEESGYSKTGSFAGVEAVSFTDCDGDGLLDVIIIISYADKSSEEKMTVYQKCRIYIASDQNGKDFYIDKKLSEKVNNSKNCKTIGEIIKFLD